MGNTTELRVLYVVTDAVSVGGLLRRQLAYMTSRGVRVAVASNPGPKLQEVADELGISAFPVPMRRNISPAVDLASLLSLVRVILQFRPNIVNAGTPKAGLLGTLAAKVCGVPHRYYVVRGLRLETTHGFKANILTAAERMASRCATRVICVSHSLKQEYLARRLSVPRKALVLGSGSSQGVDSAYFNPRMYEKGAVRRELGIPESAFVVGYVGRLTADKGIEDLVRAFSILQMSHKSAVLVLVGRFDNADPLPPGVRSEISENPRIFHFGHVLDPRPYYASMDVFAFPSRREGFPNVVLEASAMELPVVAVDATGSADAVHPEVTGALVPPNSFEVLAQALLRYFEERERGLRHGTQGRMRVVEEFQPERVHSALLTLYCSDQEG